MMYVYVLPLLHPIHHSKGLAVAEELAFGTVEEVSYFDIVVFGKQAENLKQWLTKGRQVAVTGMLKQDRWVSKDGKKMSQVSIIANNVQFLGGQSDRVQSNGSPIQPEGDEGFDDESFYYSEDVPF